MNATPPESGTTGAPLMRDVLTIVLAGIALGAAFNAMQLASDPAHAIPWVRSERRVVTLEKVSGSGLPMGSGVAARAGEPSPATAASADPPATSAAAPPAHAARPAAGAHESPRPAGTSAAREPAPAKSASSGAPSPSAGDAAAAPRLPAIPESADPMEASLDVLKAYQAQGAALVLDARPAEEYAEGHIAGAINLPFDDVFKRPELVKTVAPGARPVITYCGGGDCELSRSLAFSFVDAGYRRVLVFTGGLPAWKAAGLPTHTGARP
jgi:rhodanese-related sulfurtransferase